jgi:HEAT repeat protein
MRLSHFALFACVLLLSAGCFKDPYDPHTWMDKLDSAEWEKAVVQLERLRDPVAIPALGEAWERYNKHPKILRAIINISKEPAGPKMETLPPNWTPAVPILIKAVDGFDIANRRSVEDAVVAAEALGKSKDPSAVDVLIRASSLRQANGQDMPKLNMGHNLRIAAVQALGNFGDNPKAIDALIKVLEIDVEKQPQLVNAAAANALAQSGSQKAIQPLLLALYKIPAIYRQVRGALVTTRGTAAPELVKVLKGEHTAVEALAKEYNFANNCAAGEGPRTTCIAPGNLDFKAAAILGDMRYKEAVPAMVAELNEPGKIAFFDPRTGQPGPTDHQAVLDALRKIGDPSAAGTVLAYVKNTSTDDAVRPMAIDVFSFLARGTEGMDWLAAQMKDDAQEEEVRKASALSYARLVYQEGQLEPLQWMIDRYNKKAEELEAQAASTKDALKKGDLTREASGYRDLAYLFMQNRARAMPGIKCKSDPACYTKLLSQKTSEILEFLGIPKAEADKLDRNASDGYRIAVYERALMELAKLGTAAVSAQPVLLEQAASRDRIVRQGALLALPAVSPKPCKPCETKLDEILKSQGGSDTLSELNAETELLLEYYKSR